MILIWVFDIGINIHRVIFLKILIVNICKALRTMGHYLFRKISKLHNLDVGNGPFIDIY